MPVVVGVIVAIIFLVAFSEWFYHMVKGWNEMVLDDDYFKYRIVGVTLFSFLVIGTTFLGMALINECPNQTTEGLFANLRCDEYLKIKTGTEMLFQGKDSSTQEL